MEYLARAHVTDLPAEAPLRRRLWPSVRVDDKLLRRCDRLSGGERQRVSLARMLLSEAPSFCSQPGQLPRSSTGLQALHTVQDEACARGATLVWSLHDVRLARARFARLVGLRDGTVFFDRRMSMSPMTGCRALCRGAA